MIVDAVKAETNETRWTGTVSGEQLNSLLLGVIAEAIGVSRYKQGLDLQWTLYDDALAFTLIEDHNWHRKPVKEP